MVRYCAADVEKELAGVVGRVVGGGSFIHVGSRLTNYWLASIWDLDGGLMNYKTMFTITSKP